MDNIYYTVEQISEMLAIHPKTIQRYIREGKLRATKIGKSWRVTGHDLSMFTEHAETTKASKDSNAERNLTASCVVDIDVVVREEAIRIMNTLTATLNAKPLEYGRSSMQTQFIETENKVRVTLWGGILFMTAMLDTIYTLIKHYAEDDNNEDL